MKPRQSIKHVPVDCLRSHDHNRQLVLDKVDEIAASMQEHGVLLPLVVTEHPVDFALGHWLILDGHHRAAAARSIGLTTVPVVVRHDLDNDVDEQLVVMLVANCQRQELSAIDRAEMLGQLRHSQGLTMAEISRRTGLSESRVSESLSLLELDPETRQRVRDGQVGVGQATQAVRQVRAAVRTGTALRTPPANRKPKISVEPAWFTGKHPLYQAVELLCGHTDASVGRVRPTIGGVGCGQCWEQAIRADETKNPTTQGHSV